MLLGSSAFNLHASSPPAEAPAPLFAPDGYRIDQFRSPVPATAPGAKTVDTDDVRALRASDSHHPPVLVDVLPLPPRPEGLAATALWLPPVRYNIPGSAWLPNVGYGRVSDALDDYFRSNLDRLSGGDKARSIVIYCLADCWMSWNAARRAAEYGYERVLWYPDGTDGWSKADLPLSISKPVPMDTVPNPP